MNIEYSSSCNIMISIITPVYNVEKHLRRCIDSILGQSFRHYELILVDDGSNDGSSLICDEYAKQDSRVKVVHTLNQGVSHARNIGLAQAQGTYIVFVDSDDSIDSNYLKLLLEHADYDMVVAGVKDIWIGAHKFIERPILKDGTYEVASNQFASKIFEDYTFHYPVSKLFRNDIIRNHHLQFKESIKLSEDTLFVVDYLQHCKWVKILSVTPYSYYRYPTGTLSSSRDYRRQWHLIKANTAILHILQNKFTETLTSLSWRQRWWAACSYTLSSVLSTPRISSKRKLALLKLIIAKARICISSHDIWNFTKHEYPATYRFAIILNWVCILILFEQIRSYKLRAIGY